MAKSNDIVNAATHREDNKMNLKICLCSFRRNPSASFFRKRTSVKRKRPMYPFSVITISVKGGDMKKQLLNYETLLKITKVISHSKDPEEVVLMTVEAIKTALDVKGCTIFLINRETNNLEIAASYGLSDEYLNKGPISASRSIAQSLEEGPVAIYDVTDDPKDYNIPKRQKQREFLPFSLCPSLPPLARLAHCACIRPNPGNLPWRMSILFRQWPI